ncbi:hypothetical protein IWQ56_001362 [Coemansia nantahalensis]|nr:hypothetical protein IWQ56_001362 [Coemansia nantahalensis]
MTGLALAASVVIGTVTTTYLLMSDAPLGLQDASPVKTVCDRLARVYTSPPLTPPAAGDIPTSSNPRKEAPAATVLDMVRAACVDAIDLARVRAFRVFQSVLQTPPAAGDIPASSNARREAPAATMLDMAGVVSHALLWAGVATLWAAVIILFSEVRGRMACMRSDSAQRETDRTTDTSANTERLDLLEEGTQVLLGKAAALENLIYEYEGRAQDRQKIINSIEESVGTLAGDVVMIANKVKEIRGNTDQPPQTEEPPQTEKPPQTVAAGKAPRAAKASRARKA